MKIAINKVIQVLIISDLSLWTGWGLMAPIFAIFITGQIQGGDLEVAGYAAAIYWIVKAITIVPLGRYLDRNHGEKDDLWFLILGNVLGALAIFGYIFSTLPWHIYVLQGIYALGMAMNIPGYTAIFTRHIDKGKEAFEWSVRSCLLSLGTGLAGALGGIIAHRFGFSILFSSVAVLYILSGLIGFLIYKDIIPQGKLPRKIIVAKDSHLTNR